MDTMFLAPFYTGNFFESFVTLFSELSPVVGLCFFVGLVLIVIEVFQQGLGVFGASGCILTVLGMILQILKSYDLAHLFVMSFIAAAVFFTAFMIMTKLTRLGWLVRAAGIFKSLDETEVLNSQGITLCDLTPNGKVEIDGAVYDCLTVGDNIIEEGKTVVAIGVSDNYVIVEQR